VLKKFKKNCFNCLF